MERGNGPVLELAIKIDETVKRDPTRWLARRASPRASDQGGLVCDLAERGRGGAHLPHHQAAEGILMVTQITLGDISVDVVKKDIKNIHLSVYPPTGQGADLRAIPNGSRHHPRVCHFQTGLDQDASSEAVRTGP